MQRNDAGVRIGLNDAFLRGVNEALRRGSWPGEEDAEAAFRCECARLGCNLMVNVTIRDYERVRKHSRRFVLAPGHEVPEAETVVERRGGYVVVEKRDDDGRLADAIDPRR